MDPLFFKLKVIREARKGRNEFLEPLFLRFVVVGDDPQTRSQLREDSQIGLHLRQGFHGPFHHDVVRPARSRVGAISCRSRKWATGSTRSAKRAVGVRKSS